ncbi:MULTISPECIES: LacI family DNA-binding transcriptional regulator [unclassified Rhizobacter]|uniref:LacI family DNA-binding transcriptional regulator n=1 Tax=unclassified Rhizobacter TaxID=2640088 RepID=UPI0006F2BE9B|nr:MULTISPECIES: LacI family DNA-binding transcriptional regulator [unclassified Rhizobacter]KQU73426.1 LacI family transcriptional regulator [Rhizobacter sp. Root29]KQV98611.1 LacI family transcriptional regulator [Rhizobacter sp. Root1238]KRB04864.1 LacI family transcriptional regulator [Rhizobacter sp. Root16D2]
MSTDGVTIRDIAEAAGVSIGTVSRALKNQRGLSDETRRQVREVARNLGYDPGRLRSAKARRLLFMVHRHHSSFSLNPFFSQVMHGVEEACREFGVVPTVLSTGPADPVRQLLRLHEPDALMAAGYFEAEVVDLLRAMDLPLALVDFWMPGCRAVNPDNAQGGYLATQHLLAQGYRRIAYLAGSLAHFSIRERERGYRRALFEAGVLADPDLEVVAPPGLDTSAGAEAAMRELLKLRPRPDAVFAYNDMAALAAIRVCQAAGLRVPQDIAFVGFDDIAAAAYGTMGLTTMRVDKEALGRTGVEMVMQGDSMPQDIVQPVELVLRESSGSPR